MDVSQGGFSHQRIIEFFHQLLDFCGNHQGKIKGSGTTAKIFAAAYMTGILPIKEDVKQSAISDFKEFTMMRRCADALDSSGISGIR